MTEIDAKHTSVIKALAHLIHQFGQNAVGLLYVIELLNYHSSVVQLNPALMNSSQIFAGFSCKFGFGSSGGK